MFIIVVDVERDLSKYVLNKGRYFKRLTNIKWRLKL